MWMDLVDDQLIQAEVVRPTRLIGPPGSRFELAVGDATWADRFDDQGAARVELPAMPMGQVFDARLSSDAGDVHDARRLIAGDLWVCGGQSNMAMSLDQTLDAQAALEAADDAPIRLGTLAPSSTPAAPDRAAPCWSPSNRAAAARFSAVAFHFGLTVAQRTGRPIGLIDAAVGATPAEAWTPLGVLASDADFAPMLDRHHIGLAAAQRDAQGAAARAAAAFARWDAAADAAERAGCRIPGAHPKFTPEGHPWAPGGLFDRLIRPLTAAPIRGVIWYQGEAAPERAQQYGKLFTAMIHAWREAWRHPDLPFLFVQLPGFGPRRDQPGEHSWAEMREAQAEALRLPATGMAVTIDAGEATNIHPRWKRVVGERLALQALAKVYGQPIEADSPTFAELEIQGSQAKVRFDHTAGGLMTTDGQPVRGFAVAPAGADVTRGDRGFRWAEARIEGDAVLLRGGDVPDPAAVRYAWAQNPDVNLTGGTGLPAAPFRTDAWPGVTFGNR